MTGRPPVSVVMPFAGNAPAAVEALAALRALATRDGDERILAFNGGARPAADREVRVVDAIGEASPAHARNVGAAHARNAWILFLDADCRVPADLLDRFFEPPPDRADGALAGAVVPAAGAPSFASRYGASRSFLDQGAHLEHPFLPRAVAANLLVRREAFSELGGFEEGVRAAEDTDFSWRLQRAGWRLAARPQAEVEHVYRASLRALRAQWRGYAAGRAWLGRRYPGFVPEPALRRAGRRILARAVRGTQGAAAGAGPRSPGARRAAPAPRLQRAGFAAVDALLGVEELVGLTLSNRPAARPGALPAAPARLVLVADRYPAAGDPLAELAGALAGARVEAAARPAALAPAGPGDPPVHYREDDGAGARLLAWAALVARHPLRCARDRLARAGDPAAPTLREIAPVVARLRRDPDAPIRALGGGGAAALVRRLAALSGRRDGGTGASA